VNNARAPAIPETIAQMSMARRIQIRVSQIINKGKEWEKREASEWLDLWRHRRVLNQSQSSRFKELMFLWEKRCLGETGIVITTCNNSYTLDPDTLTASVVIIDECSQAIEPAALLPIT
jgi:superfamily I DNA and/or RNA helicase